MTNEINHSYECAMLYNNWGKRGYSRYLESLLMHYFGDAMKDKTSDERFLIISPLWQSMIDKLNPAHKAKDITAFVKAYNESLCLCVDVASVDKLLLLL
jgi:hypothetical protein